MGSAMVTRTVRLDAIHDSLIGISGHKTRLPG